MSVGENFGRETKFYIIKIDKKGKTNYNKKRTKKGVKI